MLETCVIAAACVAVFISTKAGVIALALLPARLRLRRTVRRAETSIAPAYALDSGRAGGSERVRAYATRARTVGE